MQALFRALAGNEHDGITMSGSSRPRAQDHRGHENRRRLPAHSASRPAPERGHGTVNHDRSSLQNGRSIREYLISTSTDVSTSRPIPEDQQDWRRFDSNRRRLESDWRPVEMGLHAGMIVDLPRRREDNNAARPVRSFTSLTAADSRGLEKGFVLQVRLSISMVVH